MEQQKSLFLLDVVLCHYYLLNISCSKMGSVSISAAFQRMTVMSQKTCVIELRAESVFSWNSIFNFKK